MSVILRKRTLHSGHTILYLEVNQNGKQKTESLHLSLIGNRLQDRETLKRARAVRDLRAAQILDTRFGPVTNPSKKSVEVVEYAERLVKGKELQTRKSTATALTHFTR